MMIGFCGVEWNRKWESGFERIVANNGRLEPRTRKCRSDDKVSIRSDDRVSMGRQKGARGVIVDKVSIYDRVLMDGQAMRRAVRRAILVDEVKTRVTYYSRQVSSLYYRFCGSLLQDQRTQRASRM